MIAQGNLTSQVTSHLPSPTREKSGTDIDEEYKRKRDENLAKGIIESIKLKRQTNHFNRKDNFDELIRTVLDR